MNLSKKLAMAIGVAASMLACNLTSAVSQATPTPEPTATTAPVTPSGTEQAAGLVGEYYCSGHEAGMLAAAAMLELTEEGKVIDIPPPGIGGQRSTGTWRYQSESDRILFEGSLDYQEADYSMGSGRLVIQLNEGVERVHAEEGVMTCEPR